MCYLAKIDLSSYLEQDITVVPTVSTTSPQEAQATPKKSTDPCPSINTSPPIPAAPPISAAPIALYSLINLINTILYNIIYHLLPSIYAYYLLLFKRQ